MTAAIEPSAAGATVAGESGADDAAALVARSGTSFYWAMRLLPAESRQAMFAIYAFCRVVDDVVDEPGTLAEKEAGLAEWRAEIARIYDSAPATVIGRQLAIATRRFGLRREDFMAVIDGMEMDMRGPLRGPPMAVLDLYCARVACAVGHLSVRAFGAPEEGGRKVAEALGRALQLTNILRDLDEDARLGRLYLPDELLTEAGIADRDPAMALSHPALPQACDRLAARARAHFAEAASAMAECPRASMRAARVMMETYRRILDRLAARGWTRLDQPVSLPKAVKLFVALRHGLL